MKGIILVLVCTLIPIRIGYCKLSHITTYGFSPVPDPEAENVFGVKDLTDALSENCGSRDSLLERNLRNICIVNLLFASTTVHPPYIASDAYYRTVFEATVMNDSNVKLSKYFRVTRVDGHANTGGYFYALSFASSTHDAICIHADRNCGNGSVTPVIISISKDFFTDLKIDINNEFKDDYCSDPESIICSSTLCMYINSLYNGNCGKCYDVSLGIREKRGGGLTNTFKTIEVKARMKNIVKGSERDEAFYFLKKDELTQLILAADCRAKCLDMSSGMAYCEGHSSCPAGTIAVDYDGSDSTNYPDHLISDYAYVREHECDSNNAAYNVCASLMAATPAAYASENIIFDGRLGGKPRCDCAPTYMWDGITKVCIKCNIKGSHPKECDVPCRGRCDENEQCLIDNDEVQKCHCKTHFTRMSKQGKCEPQKTCENGTIITSLEGVACKCNDGYYNIMDSGPCTRMSQANCSSGTNLLACSTLENNLSPCICGNGSIIQRGMCGSLNCGCASHEECALHESGSATCACTDGYTKINDDETCFAIFDCQPDETLRFNDDDELLCNCKEGKIVQNEGDTIVCLDSNNNKFDCFFCLLLMIVLNVLCLIF